MPAEIKQTMCPMNCHPTLCGMRVEVDEGIVTSITGDPDNPDSQGYLCMRGNAAHEIVSSPDRLKVPMQRVKRGVDEWREISWEAALDLMVGQMRKAGPEAVGIWTGHGTAVNDYGVGVKRGQSQRFANLYGAQRWDGAMICWGMGGFGLGLTGALETSTKEDMGDHSEMIVLWGANTVSQANTIRHVDRAKRRGAEIVVVDVRRTEVSALADDVLLVRPGSDAALALAMMHVIVAEGLHDDDFIAAHTVGFDALRDHLADKTPEWAAELTGLSAEVITAFARAYGATRPAMIVLGGSSIHKGGNEWKAARAISCLPALTGDYSRAGGGLGPRHGARSHGAAFNDIGAADRRAPGPIVPNQMEAIIEALEGGDLEVMLLLGSNILSSFADSNRLRAAMEKTDLIVSYDIFANQTTREIADVILPGTIWLEEIGVKATNSHVYLSDQVLPPAGQARPMSELYRELGERLGVEDVYPWESQEEAINEVLDHPATGHATVESMRANGGRAALNISPVAYPTHEFHSPSGKIEFYSERAVEMGLPALPVASAPRSADGLVLAHGRTFAHFHSFYDNGRVLPTFAAREVAPQLWLSPDDASARGVADGDDVRLTNERGTFQAVAKVTPRMPAGAVWVRDGWAGLNALMDSTAVLPEPALAAFPFSVGQSDYGAIVQVDKLP
ncbi:MAG: molybdopterin-containing oxidoreductase family protein [Pikeienuella sp.]